MALDDFFEDFTLVEKKAVLDGLGGTKSTWVDGVIFKAGISTDNSREAQIAYQTGAKTIFTIVLRKDTVLKQNNHVRRALDGRIYRITSNTSDMATPSIAENQYHQATAEVVEP